LEIILKFDAITAHELWSVFDIEIDSPDELSHLVCSEDISVKIVSVLLTTRKVVVSVYLYVCMYVCMSNDKFRKP